MKMMMRVLWMTALLGVVAVCVGVGQQRAEQRERNRQVLEELIGEIADRPDDEQEGERLRAMVIDGVFEEWPEGVRAVSDGKYLYLRIDHAELTRLFAPGREIRLSIDADRDGATGVERRNLRLGEEAGGADFEVLFDEEQRERGPRRRVSAIVFAEDGETRRAFDVEQLRPMFAPTHAFAMHEVRVALPEGVRLVDKAAALMRIRDGEGERDVAFTVRRLPSAHADVVLPPMIREVREDALRVVAHNVLWSNPEEDPEPFGRMYRALDADVYLLQEWGREEPTADHYERVIADWFATHVDAEAEWAVVRGPAWGVAIVTRLPVVQSYDEEMRAETESRWDFPVRYVAARVRTKLGDLAFASVHLKCCGGLDSEEDLRRFDEAGAISEHLLGFASASDERGPAMIVVGGDYNHNGHPRIMDRMIGGLDVDGSSLRVARTLVLNEKAVYTWGGETRGHRRSTLDYIAYADEALAAASAFVLDTTVLPTAALGRHRLERGDSNASDHLPIVVDLVTR